MWLFLFYMFKIHKFLHQQGLIFSANIGSIKNFFHAYVTITVELLICLSFIYSTKKRRRNHNPEITLKNMLENEFIVGGNNNEI